MPLEFDIKLKAKDMFRFNMYQTYSGFSGWSSIIFSIILFPFCLDTRYNPTKERNGFDLIYPRTIFDMLSLNWTEIPQETPISLGVLIIPA